MKSHSTREFGASQWNLDEMKLGHFQQDWITLAATMMELVDTHNNIMTTKWNYARRGNPFSDGHFHHNGPPMSIGESAKIICKSSYCQIHVYSNPLGGKYGATGEGNENNSQRINAFSRAHNDHEYNIMHYVAFSRMWVNWHWTSNAHIIVPVYTTGATKECHVRIFDHLLGCHALPAVGIQGANDLILNVLSDVG